MIKKKSSDDFLHVESDGNERAKIVDEIEAAAVEDNNTSITIENIVKDCEEFAMIVAVGITSATKTLLFGAWDLASGKMEQCFNRHKNTEVATAISTPQTYTKRSRI